MSSHTTPSLFQGLLKVNHHLPTMGKVASQINVNISLDKHIKFIKVKGKSIFLPEVLSYLTYLPSKVKRELFSKANDCCNGS